MLNSIQEFEDDLPMIENIQNIEKLIQLKFIVEREYNSLEDLFTSIAGTDLVHMTKDLDIYAKLLLYRNNMEIIGRQFLDLQKNLLNDIDELLMRKCEHNWIEDVIDEPLDRSRDICYCSKCYIYTKK